MPVVANAWMSPVQPRRSSRWEASVGTARKFDHWPQRIALWIWFTSALSDVNVPNSGRSDADDAAFERVRLGAGDLDVAEAAKVKRASYVSAVPVPFSVYVSVCWAERRLVV